MNIEQELAKRMADQAEADVQRAFTTGAVHPAGLSGTGLTLQDVMATWWKLEADLHQACPWLRWKGKAQLKLDEGNYLPTTWPAVVIQAPDEGGVIVLVKPAALDEIRKAWRELGQAQPYASLFQEPTNEEVAAMFAWLSELQAAREGKPAPKREPGIVVGLNLDQV